MYFSASHSSRRVVSVLKNAVRANRSRQTHARQTVITEVLYNIFKYVGRETLGNAHDARSSPDENDRHALLAANCFDPVYFCPPK